MRKVLVIEHCSECTHAFQRYSGDIFCEHPKCPKPQDLVGEIPEWCPLEDHKENEVEELRKKVESLEKQLDAANLGWV